MFISRHTRRRDGVGYFLEEVKINTLLLSEVLKGRKAWTVALILERWIFTQKSVQDIGGKRRRDPADLHPHLCGGLRLQKVEESQNNQMFSKC